VVSVYIVGKQKFVIFGTFCITITCVMLKIMLKLLHGDARVLFEIAST